MNTIFMLTLQQTATQGNAFMQFLPLILIVVVFWFFMIRPQMKRQKELKKYRDELKKGHDNRGYLRENCRDQRLYRYH